MHADKFSETLVSDVDKDRIKVDFKLTTISWTKPMTYILIRVLVIYVQIL